jgi:hypothetical protein
MPALACTIGPRVAAERRRTTVLALSLSLTACVAELTREPAASFHADPVGSDAVAPTDGATGGGRTVENAPIVISEVMYHPVMENALEEGHEFVEIFNRSGADVSLAGWKMRGNGRPGSVRFDFPPGTTIRSREYLVVAKNKELLAGIARYRISAANVLGGYGGELDNGKGRIELVDADGFVVDALAYRDEFPWPVGADALGASEKWITDLPSHQYMGRSLERISFDPSYDGEIANWDASGLDGATPGSPNSVAGTPQAMVQEIAAAPMRGGAADAEHEGGKDVVFANDTVAIRAVFSAAGSVTSPQVEYFVDDLDKSGEPVSSAPLVPVDVADGKIHQAILPSKAANTIVRYRVVVERGGRREVISPRPSDPYGWWAYFVSPTVTSASPVYHMLISPKNWGLMWTYSAPRQYIGVYPYPECKDNPHWRSVVPAVLVVNGKVYDVHVRYSGSHWNRKAGSTIESWPGTRPVGGPSPLLALSWKIKFPAFNRFDGQREIFLRKLVRQSCPGIETFVATKLMTAAGSAGLSSRYVRLYVNGHYYSYAMEVESYREEFLEKHLPDERGGDLFKAQGYRHSANEGVVIPPCGLTSQQAHAAIYRVKTNDWKKDHAVKPLTEDLKVARARSLPELRAFLDKTFDVKSTLTYIAIRNWSGAWDDHGHNHYLYRKPSGKWTLFSQDNDNELGGLRSAMLDPAKEGGPWVPAVTFYAGVEGEPANRGGPNYVKDAFLRAYRAEYDQMLRDFDKTILAPANIDKLVAEWLAGFSASDLDASPGRPLCDYAAAAERVRAWARDRHPVLIERLGR